MPREYIQSRRHLANLFHLIGETEGSSVEPTFLHETQHTLDKLAEDLEAFNDRVRSLCDGASVDAARGGSLGMYLKAIQQLAANANTVKKQLDAAATRWATYEQMVTRFKEGEPPFNPDPEREPMPPFNPLLPFPFDSTTPPLPPPDLDK